jgi:transmembrane sensor
MNSRPAIDPAADEQASLWAARLEGARLSAAYRAELDAWLAADPAHRALLSKYCQFSADLEKQLPVLVETGVLKVPPPEKGARSRWGFPRFALATVALAAVTAVGLWTLRSGARFENFAVPPGQRQSFTLGDGTRVELNAHTNLQFAEQGGERRARLVEGEAFFVVSKNKARPFIVETPSGSVRVTGTTFDVRTDPGALDVTVIEGAVQVQPGAAAAARETTSVALGAGDWLSVVGGGVTVRKLSREALDDALAWRQGIVVFVDEPLAAALARFGRYHGRSIQVSPAAAKLPVSGRYSLDDLPGFLTGVEESLGIRAAKEPGGALRVGLRSE